MADKPKKVIVIDTVENDDWMKSLPGYKDEVAIHEKLAEKYEKDKKKSANSGKETPEPKPKE